MDALTHVMIGAITAQIPQGKPAGENFATTCDQQQDINWRTRAILGAMAAIFPDIDYLLFWLNPLDFLAYWHRAETHSILLAPLWSLLLTYFILKLTRIKHTKLIFTIILFGILSHICSDSLTVFGTRWFSPVFDMQIRWNLLFVFDPYLTLAVFFTGICLYFCRRKPLKYLALIFPFIYLSLVIGIKQQLSFLVERQFKAQNSASHTFELLPQPFSPFYWKVLSKNPNYLGQSYIKLADDPIATTITTILGRPHYSQSFKPPGQLSVESIERLDHLKNSELALAWNHQQFKAFRDFSDYPVFLEKTTTDQQSCYWFSDLRYHWPGITPTFRYAMCRNKFEQWQVKRLKYFSDVSQDVRQDLGG